MGVDKISSAVGRAMAPPAPGEPKPPAAEAPPVDKIAVGRQEGLEKNRQAWQPEDLVGFLRSELKRGRQEKDALESSAKELLVCLEIARRIMGGDKVPLGDHKFLMERNMEMYSRAIMLRRIKEDPEEYDRLSEDEEAEKPGDAPEADTGSDTAPGTEAGAVPVEAEAAAPAAPMDAIV